MIRNEYVGTKFKKYDFIEGLKTHFW